MNQKDEEEMLEWREQVSRVAIVFAVAAWVIAVIFAVWFFGGDR